MGSRRDNRINPILRILCLRVRQLAGPPVRTPALEQHRVVIAPHTAPHIHGHIVSAFGAGAFGVESHGDPERHPIQHGMYTEGPEVRGGMVHLNELPGLGVDIDWAFVNKHRA